MRSSTRHSLAVLGAALFLRVAVVVYALRHFGFAWYYSRGVEMGLLANSLVQGRGLSSPFGPPTGATAMIAPGYPLLVAGVFRLLGSYSATSAMLLISLNVTVNLLTVLLILQLGRRLAGERAGVCAGLLWACSPPLLWMPTIFWETSLSTLALVAAVAGAMWLRGDAGPGANRGGWLGCGAFCALAGLLNPALLPALFGLVTVAIWKGSPQKVRNLLLFCTSFALLFSAWPMRNARVFDAWIPTRTTVGLELWIGNHAGANGFLDQPLFPSYNVEELNSYRELGEVKYMQQKMELAKAYVQAHPAEFARLTQRRIARFWTGSGSRPGSAIFILHACLTTVLGLMGLVMLMRSEQKQKAVLLLVPLALFPLPYYITHAEFRYRLVLDPLLTILGAVAVQRIYAWHAAWRA